MRAGMRRWTLRAGRCVCALTVIAASIAEAQQSSIGGVVTDQATGQALEAARVILIGPNRIEEPTRKADTSSATWRRAATGSGCSGWATPR